MTSFGRVGELTTSTLLVSILSGLVVAYQYEVADPFISCAAMEALIPFGPFFRALHFWSSQAFLLLLGLHIVQSIPRLSIIYATVEGRIYWTVLVVCLVPPAVFALFTGYVLRWDATGKAAGMIAEHLLLDIPVLGRTLDRFFVAIANEGLNRVYAVHILLAAILWGIGTWYHTKRVFLRWWAWFAVLIASGFVSLIFHAPIDLPQQASGLIKGPWFFLGVQELLRYLPPVVAGVIYPVMPVFALAVLAWVRDKRPWLWFIAGWGLTYLGLLLLMSIR
ncbi:cytochrome b N-terminal domain-containing protein [Dissulfurimicrobium hydrothermale]|uniref:cytochrome b N-terminal domain-containing protein n=1 Tax=Dissulfurimicrobium hydrothermale TaxID=1750598 RepID=UPI001EDACF62|nr:cytochrome b N-terminal domain-containing protein [Dissulfurimicrobium hydrothermale]UKL14545.1 cytochrome b N-terminal domain-containing protein [Dissulfurimicrobium hydrothermale]